MIAPGMVVTDAATGKRYRIVAEGQSAMDTEQLVDLSSFRVPGAISTPAPTPIITPDWTYHAVWPPRN